MSTRAAPVLWMRDLGSCLQATLATVVAALELDPVLVLGAAWRFRWLPDDWRSEEFYYPAGGVSLLESLAPYHPLRSTWRQAETDAPLLELHDAVEARELVIAAVDNYHLPFRPAFRDVHAGHLVVVYGVDFEDGCVNVCDAQPPEYRGPVPITDFDLSWSSANPADPQDVFFSASAIGRRWLEVDVTAPVPELTRELTAFALERNLEHMRRNGGRDRTEGLPGLRAFVRQLRERAADGDASALQELYVVGWGAQAQTDLHAEFLRATAATFDAPALAEAAAFVDRVAHAWTGLRMTGAHGRAAPAAAASALETHGNRLARSYEEALEAIEPAAEALR